MRKNENYPRSRFQKHILRSAEEGHELNWEEIFNEETERRVAETVLELKPEKLKPIWEALNGEIDYFVIQAVMCKNQLTLNKTSFTGSFLKDCCFLQYKN